jgi:hypothetical protein
MGSEFATASTGTPPQGLPAGLTQSLTRLGLQVPAMTGPARAADSEPAVVAMRREFQFDQTFD